MLAHRNYCSKNISTQIYTTAYSDVAPELEQHGVKEHTHNKGKHQ